MEENKNTPLWSNEEVDSLNKYQNGGHFHPFTCCGPSEIKECERISGKSEGLLIATENGWVCPCGKYTQNWAHGFMLKNDK
jgi:hypothetical protein